MKDLDARRKHLQVLQAAFHQSRGTASEQDKYREVVTHKRALHQWARRQRAMWIQTLCQQLDTAMRLQDMGRFHFLLRQLGVNL